MATGPACVTTALWSRLAWLADRSKVHQSPVTCHLHHCSRGGFAFICPQPEKTWAAGRGHNAADWSSGRRTRLREGKDILLRRIPHRAGPSPTVSEVPFPGLLSSCWEATLHPSWKGAFAGEGGTILSVFLLKERGFRTA